MKKKEAFNKLKGLMSMALKAKAKTQKTSSESSGKE